MNPQKKGLLRAERLRKINSILSEYGVPAWNEANLGDISQCVPEIEDITDVREIGPKRIEIEFSLSIPGGEQQRVRLRFGGRIISVIPLLTFVHGDDDLRGLQCGLVKRWRIEKGDMSLEVPHGLSLDASDPIADASPLDSPSHRILASTFGDVFTDAMTAAKVVKIGEYLVKGESHPAECFVYAAMVQKPFPRKKGDGQIFLMQWDKLVNVVRQGTYVTDVNAVALLLQAAQKYDIG